MGARGLEESERAGFDREKYAGIFLRDMMSLELTEDNINEYGRFDALKTRWTGLKPSIFRERR
jgi:hypothetical protein